MHKSRLSRFIALLMLNAKLCAVEISSNKRRTLITSFGIFLGMASLLVLLSFMRGMQKMVSEELVKMGGLSVISVKTIEPQDMEDRIVFQRSPGLTLEQLETVKSKIPEIDRILPKYDEGMHVTSMGRESRAMVSALTPGHFTVFNYELATGRALNDDDMIRTLSVCVIGQRVVEQIFKETDPIGGRITIKGRTFTVIGVLKTEDMWDWRARMVIFPYTVYERYFATSSSKLEEIALSVTDVSKLKEVKEALHRELLSEHRGVQDFDIVLNETKIKEQESTTFALNALIAVLSGLSLLIGGIGITNIMFATIGDRIREIGLRKALGARRGDLFLQFLLEAVIVTSVGAIPGIVVGSIPMLFLQDVLPIEPTLSQADYTLAIMFTIITGVAAGLFPAIKAAALNPVEALTHA
ncbi:MAG: ABC transporter permease [Fibrobacteres bacterium]|nr:ABC transporter permease [Fibrobacterota bacterium]